MLPKYFLFFIGITLIIESTHGNSNEIDGKQQLSSEEWNALRDKIREALNIDVKKTLNEWHNVSLSLQLLYSDRNMFKNFIKTINQDCVREKLKIENRGENTLTFGDALRIITPANFLCMENDGKGAIRLMTQEILQFHSKSRKNSFETYRDCFSKKLKELDPTSKFIDDFDENTMIHDSEECERNIDVRGSNKMIKSIEYLIGDFPTATCGHFTENDFNRILFTMPFFVLSENEELRKSEAQKMDDFVQLKFNQVYECATKDLA